MLRLLARMLLVFVPVLVASSAPAHDSWINRGGFKSPVSNEWCCGEGDCFVVPKNNVSMRRDGYSLNGAEIVPFAEALPSPDGAFWRCKRPDGTRRCFFAPPPGS